MKKDLNKKFIVSVSMFVVMVLLLAGALWFGLFSRLEAEREEYENSRASLSELEQKVDFKQELIKEYESISEDIKTAEGALLDADDKLNFIEELETTATSTGNTYVINSANEIYEGTSDRLEQINFNLNLTGGFSNIMAFLREINSMPYIMEISRFSANTSGEDVLRTTIELKVFAR